MNKLFVRLVASGLMTVTMGAGVALADSSASIDLTGPGSTNVISDGSHSSFRSATLNRLNLQNFNAQNAVSGSVRVCCNTVVYGGGLGSGNAANFNSAQNNVYVANQGAVGVGGFAPINSGSGSGSVFLTGPDSFNRIVGGNHSSVTSAVSNSVNAQNVNAQTARSGNVTISGNTVVHGVGGSGSATNYNAAQNNVSIANQQPTWMAGNWGPTGYAVVSTTGPGSFNAISGNNSTRTNLTTVNNVNTSNSNFQTARTGDVTISHNTVVSGVGGSGDATNSNTGTNNIDLQNN